MHVASRGFAWGALGVLIFALTMPMTRLAVGGATAPQLPPAFVTAGRRWPGQPEPRRLWFVGRGRLDMPPRTLLPALAVSALGTVLGFPLGLGDGAA
ncbi:MAG: hypothetical protein U1F67_04945 [Rubrivivax sp.]